MNPWNSCPQNLPADGSVIWCRLNFWFGIPFLAQFSLSAQTFTSVDNSVVYPIWTINRWRAQ